MHPSTSTLNIHVKSSPQISLCSTHSDMKEWVLDLLIYSRILTCPTYVGYLTVLVFFSSQTSYSHNFTSDFQFSIFDFRNPNLHLVIIFIFCFTWIISSILPVPRDFHTVAENLHDNAQSSNESRRSLWRVRILVCTRKILDPASARPGNRRYGARRRGSAHAHVRRKPDYHTA